MYEACSAQYIQIYTSIVIKCFLWFKMTNLASTNNNRRFVNKVPANTKHLYNIYTMMDQRRRRWADVV